jgi:hypothetical protein
MAKGKSAKKKKLKWVKPEIFRVPLSPDQAVLSCCLTPDRGVVGATFWQCMFGCPNWISESDNAAS